MEEVKGARGKVVVVVVVKTSESCTTRSVISRINTNTMTQRKLPVILLSYHSSSLQTQNLCKLIITGI